MRDRKNGMGGFRMTHDKIVPEINNGMNKRENRNKPRFQ
jgi:hypothetical protein